MTANASGSLCDVLQTYVDCDAISGAVALIGRGDGSEVVTVGATALHGKHPMRWDTIFHIASLTKPITAMAAMMLVEDGRLHLDEPVDGLLPELADRHVLKRIDSPLDDTEPARRPITVEDLLTFRLGLGACTCTARDLSDPARDCRAWPHGFRASGPHFAARSR